MELLVVYKNIDMKEAQRRLTPNPEKSLAGFALPCYDDNDAKSSP
jgi:hypothetical protein